MTQGRNAITQPADATWAGPKLPVSATSRHVFLKNVLSHHFFRCYFSTRTTDCFVAYLQAFAWTIIQLFGRFFPPLLR